MPALDGPGGYESWSRIADAVGMDGPAAGAAANFAWRVKED
jgi:pyrroloquinoline quinone (PQQ) biosynthesis protein C